MSRDAKVGNAAPMCHPERSEGSSRAPRRRSFTVFAAQDDTTRRSRVLWFAAFALTLFIAQTASACPVCYGDPDDPMVKGVNSGIWVLLGLVGAVQLGFVAMFWSFWKRGRAQKRFRESLKVIEGGPHV